jgi:hypothetical protein
MTSGIGGAGGGGPPKVGGPTGPAAPGSTSPTSGPKGASFGEVLGTKGVDKTSTASPLERLKSGELDLKGYVDVRVREATAHLEKVLSPADLEKIQDELRDVIENDPDIAALVKGAER